MGVSIEANYHSHISEDETEVVIPDSKQIMPVFLVKFSIFNLENKGIESWVAADGTQKSRREIYADGQNMVKFF